LEFIKRVPPILITPHESTSSPHFESTVVHDRADFQRMVEDYITTPSIQKLYRDRLNRVNKVIVPIEVNPVDASEEEDVDRSKELEFKSPSAEIFKNPFENEIADPILRKQRFVSTFIVGELMTDIMKHVFDMLAISESERKRMEEEERLAKEAERLRQQEESNAEEIKRKKMMLKDNTAIQTLRKMFQKNMGGGNVDISLEDDDDDDDDDDEDESDDSEKDSNEGDENGEISLSTLASSEFTVGSSAGNLLKNDENMES
jgi:hypothetical protein